MTDITSTINLKNYENFHLPTLYQTQIHLTKYSRWNDELNRRETWPETAKRYLDWFVKQSTTHNLHFTDDQQVELYEKILYLKAMPSMRAMMTAGPALELDNVAGYNCAFLTISRIASFKEAMYILACGAGVGFSVERQFINQLPDFPTELNEVDYTFHIEDNRIGWCEALDFHLRSLYEGKIVKFDDSAVRPAGARLVTFGGRASGPKVLQDLFRHMTTIFRKAIAEGQRKLTSLDCHSIVCKIGDCIVSGGVRRSATISLSNLSDNRMRNAKSGEWYIVNPHFGLANNSAVYDEKPDAETFLEEWTSLVKSKSGERGIFNRQAAQLKANENGRRDGSQVIGCNPCSEILLRDMQFCNLSSVTNRPADTFDEWLDNIRVATIFGTVQSTLTDSRSFEFLDPAWKKNCEEERLIGVSQNGVFDTIFMSDRATKEQYLEWTNGLYDNLGQCLDHGRKYVVDINAKLAKRMGINQSAGTTAVKPEGTLSQLVNCGSGLHPQHNHHYIRTNRANKIDPVAQLMRDGGIPCEDELTYPDETGELPESTKWVFSFPIKAPEGAVVRSDISAIDHLKLWFKYANHWCEHKPSITVSVRDHEWCEVAAFVYKHFDKMSGVAFLPMSDHQYEQAPYQDCSQEQYRELLAKMPVNVDWSILSYYEKEDQSTGSREFACVAGSDGVLACSL